MEYLLFFIPIYVIYLLVWALARKFPNVYYLSALLAGILIANRNISLYKPCTQHEPDCSISVLSESIIAVTVIFLVILSYFLRKRLTEILKFWSNTKLFLATMLTVGVSKLHIILTKPCENPVGWMCDFYIGFPITFFLVSDYFSPGTMLLLVAGIICNVTIWFALLSIVFYPFRKTPLSTKQEDSGTDHTP